MRNADEQQTSLDLSEVQDSITVLPVRGVQATELHAALTQPEARLHSRYIQLDIPFVRGSFHTPAGGESVQMHVGPLHIIRTS
jgi:hypothetical protein